VLDALRLAHDGGARQMLLLVPVDGGVRIDRVDVARQRVIASVHLPVRAEAVPPIPRALLVEAVRALVTGESLDFSVEPAVAVTPWNGPHAHPMVDAVAAVAHRGGPRPHAILGWVLGGVGLAALGASFGLELHSRSQGDRYADALPGDIDFLSRQGDWKTWRGLALSVGAFGSLAASVGIGFVVPERDHVPWLAWVSGGVGLGLVAGGVLLGIGAKSCGDIAGDRAACVERAKAVDFGALLSLVGAPLLSVPLSYLLMPTSSHVSARLDLSPAHVGLVFEGRL